ncbi:MAG: hypothetical protein ACREMK_06470 [Gemmatimonadota bacterium]
MISRIAGWSVATLVDTSAVAVLVRRRRRPSWNRWPRRPDASAAPGGREIDPMVT